VQTFLPYPDLRASCVVLDDRRLGKQRVETFQILRALTWPEYAWKNHPAVRMWRGFRAGARRVRPGELPRVDAPRLRRLGRRQLVGWTGGSPPSGRALPPWFGLEPLHQSHRSAAAAQGPRALPAAVRGPRNVDEPDDLPYLWPPDVFPRWPVRAGGPPAAVQEGVRLLGFDEPRAGQAEAATAVAAGRDVPARRAAGHRRVGGGCSPGCSRRDGPCGSARRGDRRRHRHRRSTRPRRGWWRWSPTVPRRSPGRRARWTSRDGRGDASARVRLRHCRPVERVPDVGLVSSTARRP
jgi:hypothetical protein